MKKTLLLFALLFPSIVVANPIDDQCPQFVSHGAPISSRVNTIYMCKQNYAVNYRTDTKTAEYVVEHLTVASINGPAKRQDNFHSDSSLPVQYQSAVADYLGSGYDRGHLAPAGDNTTTADVMSESFLLSNMVPQNPNNNRVIWNHLETKIRSLVTNRYDVYVISGTIYQPGFKTVGRDKVGVPTFLWKVIYNNTNDRVAAFLIPNTALNVRELPKLAITVSDLEKLTAIQFIPLTTNPLIKSDNRSARGWLTFN